MLMSTRQTFNARHSRPPRFKAGDKVRPAFWPDKTFTVYGVNYDSFFGGWLVLVEEQSLTLHEQNFILADEVDQWKPHKDDPYWSWWERKGVKSSGY